MTDGGTGSVAAALTHLLACRELPETLPSDPMPLLTAWLRDAEQSGRYEDANAMTIATATPDGQPSARIVLCKAIECDPPALVFYTSYRSRKGLELDANSRAAAVFHWPHAKRQARVEGAAERVPAAESDAYFRERPLLSRVGCAASHQSAPIASRQELVAAAMKVAGHAALSGSLARPGHWGGYRLRIRGVELWSARDGRLHDRARWIRRPIEDRLAWDSTRLSP